MVELSRKEIALRLAAARRRGHYPEMVCWSYYDDAAAKSHDRLFWARIWFIACVGTNALWLVFWIAT